MENDTRGQGEIIIVRRGGGHGEDEHHGGVWKIAFADFMTAMMAFFLVMWLINASNEETKQALASYFNPVKLMDTTSNPKGVRNPKYGVEATELDEEEESTKVSTPEKKQVPGETITKAYQEQALFVDPYSLLSEIEAGLDPEAESIMTSDQHAKERDSGLSLNAGPSFQDPFDPSAWNIREGKATSQEDQPAIQNESDQRVDKEPNRTSGSDDEILRAADDGAGETAETEKLSEPETEEKRLAEDAIGKEIAELATAYRQRIAELKEDIRVSGLDVEVQEGPAGAAIILSDKSQTGMFNIGSARPTQEMVRVMAKIGEAVSKHEGKVEISGHTDGRKYQSGDYDNWRLSSARAHMAYYMLVRGGMKETQVERIVGQADANLKVQEDPYSPANRRIEVLLKLK